MNKTDVLIGQQGIKFDNMVSANNFDTVFCVMWETYDADPLKKSVIFCRMTQKPRKENFRGLIFKTFHIEA